MHKPVQPLVDWPADVAPHIAANRRSALNAALLLLPERFETSELLQSICGLSYAGDVRMGIGESERKPDNIAAGQQDALARLYPDTPTEQDVGMDARLALLASLPQHAQLSLLRTLEPSTAARLPIGDVAPAVDSAARELWRGAASEREANKQLRIALRSSLSRIVHRSSLAQTVKGIASAGLATSIAYAVSKMRKRTLQDGAPGR